MCAEFTRNKNQIEWRRNMVLDLSSKGYTQKDIADILKVDRSLISLDQKYWRERAKTTVQQQLLDERIPVEVENVLNALNIIIKDTWNDITKTASIRDKTTARSLLKDIYLFSVSILTILTDHKTLF